MKEGYPRVGIGYYFLYTGYLGSILETKSQHVGDKVDRVVVQESLVDKGNMVLALVVRVLDIHMAAIERSAGIVDTELVCDMARFLCRRD